MIYVYKLIDCNESFVLLNSKEFTSEEFDIMCKEAPIFEGFGGKFRYYSINLIIGYLITTYGFTEPDYKSTFDAGNDVE